MDGGLRSRDCVARLYVPRKHGGRGVISVEDCINPKPVYHWKDTYYQGKKNC